jgi:hypothetical protein
MLTTNFTQRTTASLAIFVSILKPLYNHTVRSSLATSIQAKLLKTSEANS